MSTTKRRTVKTSVGKTRVRPSAVLPKWRLARHLRDCYRLFNAELQCRFDAFGLRVSDWSHLRVISDEEGLTQVEISRRLHIAKASSTAVLDKLGTLGLIRGKRKKDDLRKIGIYLTSKGQETVELLLPEVMTVIQLTTSEISDKEMAELVRLMDKMLLNLKRGGIRPQSLDHRQKDLEFGNFEI